MAKSRSVRPQPRRSRESRGARPRAEGSIQEVIYRVIFEADTFWGRAFDVVLLLAIFGSVTAVSLETVDSINARYGAWLLSIEWCFTLLFTLEYGLRLYCVRNRKAYALSFYGLVDLIAILPAYIGLLVGGMGSFAILRAFRLLRVFRVLNLFHLARDAEEMGRAVWKSRGKIVVFLSFVAIVVTVSGALMYEIEQLDSKNSQFTSIPQSVYWAIVTMTTVGYGDIVPHTTPGKIVSAILILIGYSLIIVPTGFVSAEIMSARKDSVRLTRVCPGCMLEGHAPDANYCRACGQRLAEASAPTSDLSGPENQTKPEA
ncbi:MAG: ion transporter [Planctomycetales bacterium]|nr:ion transporter [Planctomycetales bacterium]